MPEYVEHVWADDVGGGTPIDAATLNEMETGIDRASIVIVTALPGTPAHGDEVYYEVESGVLWHCVYDSTIVAANKWVVLGGPALHAEVDTQEAVGSASTWVNLATGGPAVTVPLDGDYRVDAALVVVNVAGAAIVRGDYGVAVGDTTPADVWASTLSAASNWQSASVLMDHLSGLSASNVVKIRYQGTTTAVAFKQRRICVTPLRVG